MAVENQSPELIPPVPAVQQEGPIAPSDADSLPTVVIAPSTPPPLGRSWAFDLTRDQFTRRGAHGPRAIYGPITLLQWIEKALHTERGALEIHPPGYGVQSLHALFGRPMSELSVQELQRLIEDALTFHPRIAAVVGMQLQREDDKAFASFKVQTDPPLDEVELLAIRLEVGA